MMTATAESPDVLRFPDGSCLTRDQLGQWADHALLELGFQAWRGHQRAAVVELLLGRDVLALMPTGTGKSLVYQLAAKLAELTKGTTRFFSPLILVISPLKSLQADQLRAADALGISAAAVNSDMAAYEIESVMEHLDRYRILFVAPEQLRNASRREAILPRVALTVIDEAHCVSSWGHDFRPSYARLAETLVATSREARGWHAPCLLLTATATEAVIGDVLRTLGLPHGSTMTLSSRPLADNIALNAIELRSPTRLTLERAQANFILSKMRDHRQGIVYCQSQAEVDRWLESGSPLVEALGDALVGFHADTSLKLRIEAMEAMHSGRAKVGVFTCAAGMGIDWSNVDLVVHKRPPDRLEAMVQEAGRAGRAGQNADHWLLWDRDCWYVPEAFLTSSNPTIEEYRRVWSYLMEQEEDVLLKSQKAIGEESGVSTYTTPTIVKQLKSWNLIELKDQAGRINYDRVGKKIHHATKWLEIQVRCAFEELPLDAQLLAEKLQRDRKGLEAMQRYCSNRKNLCREAMVDLWFRPSIADPDHKCGRCDVCTSF